MIGAMRHDYLAVVTFLALACALLGAVPSHAAEPLTWEVPSAQPARFVAVHGRRSALFGYSENGLEVWAYPLQLVDSYSVAFRAQNGATAIDGRTVLRRIVYSPEAVTRIYVGPDFVVHEKLFVPLDAPGAIVSYEVDGVRACRHRRALHAGAESHVAGRLRRAGSSVECCSVRLSALRAAASLQRTRLHRRTSSRMTRRRMRTGQWAKRAAWRSRFAQAKTARPSSSWLQDSPEKILLRSQSGCSASGLRSKAQLRSTTKTC